jgi:hypothetical protein
MKQEKNGFSPEGETEYLKRLPTDLREKNLGQELKTQLGEDFGLVEFTIKYKFDQNGKIVSLLSGEEIVELTSRGKTKEETESIKKIEEGLKNNPEQTWIGFSPKNKQLGYNQNSVDFWRVVDGKVVWNRLNVENDFQQMNEVRHFLSGEEKVDNEMEILGLPIAVEGLKLAELFDYFRLSDPKNNIDFDYIERVVNKYLKEFSDNFESDLTKDHDLIFRLYSACFNALENRKNVNEVIISRKNLDSFMYGIMRESITEKSFGCSATTTVGSFGEKVGYYVSSDGQVHHGEIPPDYKECKQCGCWYKGEKCPFC